MAVLLSATERRPNESWSFSWCSDCSQGIAGIFYYSFISILISCRLCRVTARRSLLCRKIIVPPPFFWFLFISLRLLSLRYLFFHPSTHFTNITLIFFFYFLTKFYQLSHSHSCCFTPFDFQRLVSLCVTQRPWIGSWVRVRSGQTTVGRYRLSLFFAFKYFQPEKLIVVLFSFSERPWLVDSYDQWLERLKVSRVAFWSLLVRI